MKYIEERIEKLIRLADQAQKDGNYELMQEYDREIERLRRILKLFRDLMVHEVDDYSQTR